MDIDSAAVISLESDEEMDTVAAPEAPTSSATVEEAAKEVTAPNDLETESSPPKSPDIAKDAVQSSESDVILIDDEDKEGTETSDQKYPKNLLSATELAVEVNVTETQTATNEIDDVEMMEIAEEVEENVPDCSQPSAVLEKQEKPEEMEEAYEPAAAVLESDNEKPIEIDTAVLLLPKAIESEENLPNSKRRAQKCGNPGCAKKGLDLIEAPLFAQSLYSMPPNKQKQLICHDCFQCSVNHYESLCTSLLNKESLYAREMLHDKSEEIHTVLDSSDEETDETNDYETKDLEPVLPQEAISLVDMNLNKTIDVFWKQYGEKHATMYQMDMVRELERNEEASERIDLQLKKLKATLHDVHQNIYSVRTTKIDKEELIIEDDMPSDLIAYERLLSMVNRNEPLVRNPVEVNETYFGVHSTILSSWVMCKVLDIAENHVYTVRFLSGNQKQTVLTAKHLAYTWIPCVKLKLGTRVIAKVSSTTGDTTSRAFYAGTVLESISSYNRYRYLIIFDSGHTLYAPLEDVRVVCEESKHVWDDVHPHSKEFIRNYMQTCGSLRPMVQAHRGQRIMVEINQKWYQGKVLETDSSLFKLYFQVLNRYEWIYRGSKRLAPLFSRGTPINKFSKFQRRNEPSIEYITIEDDKEEAPVPQEKPQLSQIDAKQEVQDTQARATAKKSTAQRLSNSNKKGTNSNGTTPTTNNNNVPGVISLNRNTIYIDFDKNRSHGKTYYYTTKNYRSPQKFVPHECNPACVYKIPKSLRIFNLLARPLVTGWEREFCHYRGPKKNIVVMYRAPCGRRIRDMPELHRYLRATNCSLNVECFDFDAEVRALATYLAENMKFECKDLSFGAEPMPVHCVNNYDDTQPPPCEYSTERIPTEGVNLNLDKEFLCGCDCEDDCADKSKCQCWQLTITGARFTNPYVDPNSVGYVYKRLLDPVLTGIYECNAQCKCRKDVCLNRLVQNSLQTKLQVFNTHNKGWGIRCLNDVPKGSFICIYAGHLLTEDTSNKICELSEDKTGDEYFADLDYIENAENHKADYEAEAYRSDNENSMQTDNPDDSDESDDGSAKAPSPSAQDSDEEYTSKTKPSTMVVKTRAQSRKASTTERAPAPSSNAVPIEKAANNGVNDEQECVNLIPDLAMNPKGALLTTDQESTLRKFFGENEHIYVMDAKKSGNLGRYFNHSCVPNLFVQSVFVDTHDVRFPWVAFFAYCNIKAGTELTWNYNYDVGSVNGKVLTCVCGERACKGRLL